MQRRMKIDVEGEEDNNEDELVIFELFGLNMNQMMQIQM